MVRRIRKKQHKRRKKHQRGGFLNQYGFAYAGRDMINQAMEGLDALASKIIKHAKGQLDQIAPWHIQQVKNQGGQQVEKIAPKVIKGGIEEVYKTPFRLLGRFGTKNSCIVLVEKLERFIEDNAWKHKILPKNIFISAFTFTFTTTIIVLQIVNDGNILTNGRNGRWYKKRATLLNLLLKLKPWKEGKIIGRHIVKTKDFWQRKKNTVC